MHPRRFLSREVFTVAAGGEPGHARNDGPRRQLHSPTIDVEVGMRLEGTTGVLVAVALAAAAPAWADGGGPRQPERPFDAARAEQRDFGIAGDPQKVSMSVGLAMLDTMRFVPERIEVKLGENVRLMVRNNGTTMHEMVLGTLDELKRHAEMMRMHPDMKHDLPHMAHVAPGQIEWIVWTFNRPGEFYYGCLVPGHFEAGMLGKVVVR